MINNNVKIGGNTHDKALHVMQVFLDFKKAKKQTNWSKLSQIIKPKRISIVVSQGSTRYYFMDRNCKFYGFKISENDLFFC